MGTNYYAIRPGEEDLHIGKASAGWEFLFRAHKDPEITSIADWMYTLNLPEVKIRNEYGTEISYANFINWFVTRTEGKRFTVRNSGMTSRDRHGYPFSDREFS
jgi:hypothetical protein